MYVCVCTYNNRLLLRLRSLNIYICTYIHTNIHTNIHTYIHAHIHTYIHKYMIIYITFWTPGFRPLPQPRPQALVQLPPHPRPTLPVTAACARRCCSPTAESACFWAPAARPGRGRRTAQGRPREPCAPSASRGRAPRWSVSAPPRTRFGAVGWWEVAPVRDFAPRPRGPTCVTENA